MEILEGLEDWSARFRAGWLTHFRQTGETDWKRYPAIRNRTAPAGLPIDLSASRLMLITSSGAYLRGEQEPFGTENRLGDYTSAQSRRVRRS